MYCFSISACVAAKHFDASNERCHAVSVALLPILQTFGSCIRDGYVTTLFPEVYRKLIWPDQRALCCINSLSCCVTADACQEQRAAVLPNYSTALLPFQESTHCTTPHYRVASLTAR